MIPFLQNLILKDFWLKLFSFALAALIWFTVNIAIRNNISPGASLALAPTEQVVLRDVPIVVLPPSDQTRTFNVDPRTVDVTVQGDALSVKSLARQDVRALVDLSDKEGLRDSRKRVEVATPAGLTHIKVEPEEVEVVSAPKN